MTIELTPLVGAGPIRFGAMRSGVQAIFRDLGEQPARARSDREELYCGGICVSYNEANQVEFIEISPNSSIYVLLYGKVLNAMRPEDAVAFISQFTPHVPNPSEPSSDYVFQPLQLSLWRGFAGTIQQHAQDVTDEFRFRAYGLGRTGYFDEIIKRQLARLLTKRASSSIQNPLG